MADTQVQLFWLSPPLPPMANVLVLAGLHGPCLKLLVYPDQFGPSSHTFTSLASFWTSFQGRCPSATFLPTPTLKLNKMYSLSVLFCLASIWPSSKLFSNFPIYFIPNFYLSFWSSFHPWLSEINAPIGHQEVAGHTFEWLLLIG